MKRVIFWTLAAAAGAASGAALADDDTGAFYVAPMLQYGVLDDHRAAKDDFAGDLAVGYNFAPHFSGEVNYSEGSFRIHDQQSQKLYAYTLDGMFKLLPSSIIDPYVLLGGGEMDDTVGRGNGTNHTWTAEGGLGALTGIGSQTGSFRVQLRTEAKYRREFVEASLYNPKNPGERVKVTVSILDQDLRADAVRVAASRQVLQQGGVWIDAPVEAATVQKLEDVILTRARDLRRRTIRG